MPKAPAVKMILLFKRKPGTSMDQFIDYYEKKHAPFILSINSRVAVYRRNYVKDIFIPNAHGSPDTDVITELHFTTQADFDAFTADCTKSMDKIVNDELNFVDRTTIRAFVVTENDSALV